MEGLMDGWWDEWLGVWMRLDGCGVGRVDGAG